jgi:hypothetical protein
MGAEVIIVYNRLPELIAALPKEIDAVLEAGLERIALYGQQNHPWQNETGQTEASIHEEKLGAHDFAAVFGGASIYLEWGTYKMPPFPFILPAVDAVWPSIVAELDRLAEIMP